MRKTDFELIRVGNGKIVGPQKYAYIDLGKGGEGIINACKQRDERYKLIKSQLDEKQCKNINIQTKIINQLKMNTACTKDSF